MNRIIDQFRFYDKINCGKPQLIVMSTYFTSKFDPNRERKQENDEFSYIKKWYESVQEHKIKAFIFHDSLGLDFVNQYQTKNIHFIKCRLGIFSLNDERFFIYYEFLQKIQFDNFILFTDINDVEFNKNPLELFIKFPNKLFIGRGDRKNWGSSPWNINKLKLFNDNSGAKLPSSIFTYPVFNAGLIGGSYANIMELLSLMITEFEKINNCDNHNMAVLNFVIFRNYLKKKYLILDFVNFSIMGTIMKWRYRFFRKISSKNLKKFNLGKPGEGVVNEERIFSGSPFNSMFKKFEIKGKSKAYMIHK